MRIQAFISQAEAIEQYFSGDAEAAFTEDEMRDLRCALEAAQTAIARGVLRRMEERQSSEPVGMRPAPEPGALGLLSQLALASKPADNSDNGDAA